RGPRRRGRGARAVRPAAGRARGDRRPAGSGGRRWAQGVNWRGLLVVVLLVAALVSGWSAWHQRAEPTVNGDGQARSDFILHDFEIIALSGEGEEAFTLRAPLLEQHPQDRTIEVETPLFLIPDGQGEYWEVRSRDAFVTANHDEIRLREDV